MRCERCDGCGYVVTGWLTDDRIKTPIELPAAAFEKPRMNEGDTFGIPCPRCGGTGIRHCCDGEDPDGGNDVTKESE